jgi:HK97 family phage major capsid protein
LPYNNITSRTDVESLIPEEVSNIMLDKATEDSAVLQLFRRIPVARNQIRFPVISALPMAYWVTGDTGYKQTTEMAWTNKYLNIEELATIMPIPENVFDDLQMNVWDNVEPYLREAFARALDATVIFGTNAPASFPTAVVPAAVAAGNAVTAGTAAATAGGYYADLDNLLATVEEDGFDVSGYIASRGVRRKLRAARDSQGRKLDVGRVSGDLNSLDGAPIYYPMRGLWPTGGGAGTNYEMVAGDFNSQFVVAVRQDISMKVLDQSVIQDPSTGNIIYNLAQQDMIALRIKFRVGWQVSNTLNNDQPVEGSRYPAAVLRT